LGVLDVLGVEHLHLQHQAHEGGAGGDERGVERLATRRTPGRAHVDLDVVEVLLVQALAGLADGHADGVVDVVDVAHQPGRLHRHQVVGHTGTPRRGVSSLAVPHGGNTRCSLAATTRFAPDGD
jgi:hypothetical protein